MDFAVKVTATGEVRDADGNLVSSAPIETLTRMSVDDLRAMNLTDEHLAALGLTPTQIRDLKGDQS